jgi:hypothetical protein
MDILNTITELGEITVTTSRYDSINEPTRSSTVSQIKNLSYPTDYNLREVRLTSATIGDLDLKEYLVELNYFEDIYSNFVSGKIVLSDSVGVIFLGGLNGSESLSLEFAKGQGGKTIKQTFRIFSLSDRHHDISHSYENFTLNFCSEELLMSEKYRISKSYKNKTISNIIEDLLKNALKTNKDLNIEQSSGNYDFVLPNKKIFETINWLSSYALPYSKPGADMILFENAKGYHFKSLQSLYEQTPIFEFEYNPKNVKLNYQQNFFHTQTHNIFNLEVMNNFNTLDATNKGVFNNRLITIDTINRTKKITDFKYDEYFSKSKKLNRNDVTTNNKNQVYVDRFNKALYDSPPDDKDAGKLQVCIGNSEQYNTRYLKENSDYIPKDFFIEKSFSHRNAQLLLSNYIRIKIVVPGNSDILVGSVVTVKVFETKQITKNDVKKEDTYLSGKYLVTAIRHIINSTRYTSVIELAKESNI